ncbi:MAG: thermonuclease family protein [Shinella sp.]|nr:thermonuclease family protein [Shinella sp.]
MASAWKRLRDVVLTAAILALLGLVALRLGDGGAEPISGHARAADGDTLTWNDTRVRLIGIDTPELAQTCRRDGAEWRCGMAARARMAELLKRSAVSCSTRGKDRFGRILAYCRTDEGDLGQRMVREGLAIAYGDYELEESMAQAERRGLWAGEFERPQDWRRLNGRPPEEPHQAGNGFVSNLLRMAGFD